MPTNTYLQDRFADLAAQAPEPPDPWDRLEESWADPDVQQKTEVALQDIHSKRSAGLDRQSRRGLLLVVIGFPAAAFGSIYLRAHLGQPPSVVAEALVWAGVPVALAGIILAWSAAVWEAAGRRVRRGKAGRK